MADMKVVRGTLGGAVVETSEENAERLGSAFQPENPDGPDMEDVYSSFTVDDLKAEIASRNEGREEADLIPAEGRKADLVAALEADDAK